MGLVALQQVEPYWTGHRNCVPCISRRILIHCTTREVLGLIFCAVSIEEILGSPILLENTLYKKNCHLWKLLSKV